MKSSALKHQIKLWKLKGTCTEKNKGDVPFKNTTCLAATNKSNLTSGTTLCIRHNNWKRRNKDDDSFVIRLIMVARENFTHLLDKQRVNQKDEKPYITH